MHGLGNLRRLLRPLRLIVKSPGAEPAEEKEEKWDGRAPGSRKVLSQGWSPLHCFLVPSYTFWVPPFSLLKMLLLPRLHIPS